MSQASRMERSGHPSQAFSLGTHTVATGMYGRPGGNFNFAGSGNGVHNGSLWRTRAVGTVPVSDASRRWSDCTVSPLADPASPTPAIAPANRTPA